MKETKKQKQLKDIIIAKLLDTEITEENLKNLRNILTDLKLHQNIKILSDAKTDLHIVMYNNFKAVKTDIQHILEKIDKWLAIEKKAIEKSKKKHKIIYIKSK